MFYLDHLLQLVDHQETPAISLFFPTHPDAPVSHYEDKAFLTRSIAQAKEALIEHLSHEEIQSFLQPIVDLFENPDFWCQLKSGLAIYKGPDFLKIVKTPYTLTPRVVVNSHFHLLPLIPYFEQCQKMLLLDLTSSQPELYEANAFEIQKIHLSLEQAPQESMTSGQDYVRIYQQICPFLHKNNAPLVLAGPQHLQKRFLEHCPYPRHTGIAFNTPTTGWNNPQEAIHTAFLSQLHHILSSTRQYAIEELQNLQKSSQKTLNNMREVANAAYNSRIDALFVSTQPTEHLLLPFSSGQMETTQELMDLATTHTVLNGGKVYTLPDNILPQESPVAAILRY